MLVKYEILSGADMEEKIGTDILASLQFYQKVYGVIPLNEINVTEIPYLHGEAFPGLVHLSWFNYQGTGHDKSGELMRAHEVAHQWWGIGVDFDDYHDQWISEGFAEFSALYFIQTGFGNEDYFDILDKWKKDIIENRKYILGQGQKSGPIWLGYRTNSSETEGDYSTIVYKKGAWVLHMLRNMMIDLKTMDEDRFKGLMKEFFSTYYRKKATINDFKKLADKYAGENLDWFFNQFIYGTEIPEYVFSYTTEQKADGKYYTTCKIIQKNVSENFKMHIPIKIILSGDKFARLRIEVSGKESTINLPGLPEKPEEIIFNDLNSVLCEVDYD
jgi:aminopeptidase N